LFVECKNIFDGILILKTIYLYSHVYYVTKFYLYYDSGDVNQEGW